MAGLSGFPPARASRGEGVANAVSWWRYQDAPEATCRRALNFLLALSSNRRDAQNAQIKSGPGSFDVSKSKNGCRSSATPCSQPRSPRPQAQGTAPALHDGCKFSACDFGYRADAGVRPTGGAFAPAGLEKRPGTTPGAHLRFFGGRSQGQTGARNLFRSSGPLPRIWRNEFRAPKKSDMRTNSRSLCVDSPKAIYGAMR